jgi:hypothetical protein
MMKNVNNIKPKRFDTYLNIYIGFSPLFCYFPIRSVRAKKAVVCQVRAQIRDTKADVSNHLTDQSIASLFRYYKTGGLQLFISVTGLQFTVAFLGYRTQFAVISFKQQAVCSRQTQADARVPLRNPFF